MAIRMDGEVLSGTRSMTLDVDFIDQDVLDVSTIPKEIASSDLVFVRNAGTSVLHVDGATDELFDLRADEFVLLRSPDSIFLTCDTDTLAEVIGILVTQSPSLEDITDDQGNTILIQ